MKRAAIYARVSSERQKEAQTIVSQRQALTEYAQANGYVVPEEWIFQDDGYGGSFLARPALDRLRDLAAEGQIEVVLIYSPDRLSRKYAYQVLLIDEFSRNGVEVIFLNSPQATTPEEKLLVHFQGMIAEYERAQIMERTRRGRKHRAKSGLINALAGAPYGYRYVKRTENSNAFYEILEEKAEVVRQIYRLYLQDGLSIWAITKWLRGKGIATHFGKTFWGYKAVWSVLRNPAYKGTACFGKTEATEENQQPRRILRRRGGFSNRWNIKRAAPRENWIEIPVPAIVDEETFALAQERLQRNKRFSPSKHQASDLASSNPGVQDVRLRLLPFFGTQHQGRASLLLLPLRRLRCLSFSQRPKGLRQSVHTAGLFG